MRSVSARTERWPLAKPFTISRGTKTAADVVVVEITDDDGTKGWAECVPYPRYNESTDSVLDQIKQTAPLIEEGISPQDLTATMSAGAARNALDCALWDIEAKAVGRRVWELVGAPEPIAKVTAETISIGTMDEITEAAAALKDAPLLKIKLNRDKVVTRMAAIRDSAPAARLIIDPNESWDFDLLQDVTRSLADLGVEMIEQPLPSSEDGVLEKFDSPVDLCADESCHTAETLPHLKNRYAMINIKLDKTGGLTEAIKLAQTAQDLNFGVMIGCMVGTSLAMAPATLLSPYARFVDLDGPLLLKEDRPNGLTFENGAVSPPDANLWG